MMLKAAILLLIVLVSLAIVDPAEAAFCRTVGDRTICIVEIKRSAKNYWEYRAVVSINGVVKPLEVYNCRDRIRVQPDGTVIPFASDGAGDVVCSLFKR
jgi:hypothetical protein